MQVSSVNTTSSFYKPLAKLYTVAEALAALKLYSQLKVTIKDTPANISSNLDGLNDVQAQITKITVTNSSDKLNLNGAQVKQYNKLLPKMDDNSLILSDNFSALNSNIAILRENNAKISKMILTPSADAKQTISPWDAQLWSKSVNGKFEIQTQITGPATVQSPGNIANFNTYEDTQGVAANYVGLKALDDMGMLSGIEAFKGSSITTNIAQGKALSDLFNKYSTNFHLNIRDTTSNISKNIDFIANINKKLTAITQIGDIKPLEITREQNRKSDEALSKMKNPYSLRFIA
jgi:hypothetical protein